MNDPIEQEQEQEQESSLRDDMEAAMSEVEERVESSGDEYVEETPKIEAEKAESPTDGNITPAEKPNEPNEPKAEGSEQPSGAVEAKAPQSWSPKLREEFGKLSPSVQAQINKRETEMSTFLNEGAESRKFGDRMTQTLQPYQSVLAAQGANDPVQAVKGLMDTAATLQMGSQEQKAQRLAQLIQHYGVDIQTLDNALSGTPQANPEQTQLEQMLEQKLAPMQQFMNTVQQNQQQSTQQVQQNAQTEIGQFEQTAEFMGDVRNDMADLLDMAAKRGQEMTLQQAYDKACAINPEISAVINQRASDNRIKGAHQTNNNKRYASSSIRGNQAGVNAPNANGSISDALNQAWDDQQR